MTLLPNTLRSEFSPHIAVYAPGQVPEDMYADNFVPAQQRPPDRQEFKLSESEVKRELVSDLVAETNAYLHSGYYLVGTSDHVARGDTPMQQPHRFAAAVGAHLCLVSGTAVKLRALRRLPDGRIDMEAIWADYPTAPSPRSYFLTMCVFLAKLHPGVKDKKKPDPPVNPRKITLSQLGGAQRTLLEFTLQVCQPFFEIAKPFKFLAWEMDCDEAISPVRLRSRKASIDALEASALSGRLQALSIAKYTDGRLHVEIEQDGLPAAYINANVRDAKVGELYIFSEHPMYFSWIAPIGYVSP